MKTVNRWSGVGLCAVLALLACLPQAADAQSEQEVRKRIEGSMLVTGRVTITLEGTVGDWTIDRREDLPPPVARAIDAAAPGWRFEPILVDGVPVHGSARMSLLVVAERIDDERFGVVIRGGYFGKEAVRMAEAAAGRRAPRAEEPREDQVTSLQMRPPHYPQAALDNGTQGTVYLVVRVGRSG